MKTPEEMADKYFFRVSPVLGTAEAVKKAYLAGYNTGYEAAAPKWISVEERLPENSNLVMVRGPYVPVTVGQLMQEGCWWRFLDEGDLEGGIDVVGANDSPFITHWMPLPDAPKEGEK